MLCLCVEELLAPCPNFKLEEHPSSYVRKLLIEYIRSYPLYGDRLPLPQPALVKTPYDGRRYFPLHNYLNGCKRYNIVRK